MPILFLISMPIEDESIDHIPPITANRINGLNQFIAERSRTARRFIRKILPAFDLNGAVFLELDKKNFDINVSAAAKIFETKVNVGLMSESGSPCIADPGSRIVDVARQHGYRIVPLSGPSSIILSLMASGLNGQQFTFHGYLPIKEPLLKSKLYSIEKDILKTGQTHIFIETPYRNQSLYNTIVESVSSNVRFCIGMNITSYDEQIDTKSISEWKKSKTEINKVPVIFLLGA